ncbi:MAG: four helix bundle protein [Patescibacteria group bacterium]|nr:four helix bundle protein [Patescibacteria group bacterium]
MVVVKFEDLLVWQKSRIFCTSIYANFSVCRDYSFRDQIQRAAVSIMNNIAEGHARSSDKEFRNYLYIANGSASEVRSMLYLSLDLKYVNDNLFNELNNQVNEISKMISGLISRVNENIKANG